MRSHLSPRAQKMNCPMPGPRGDLDGLDWHTRMAQRASPPSLNTPMSSVKNQLKRPVEDGGGWLATQAAELGKNP